VATAFSFSPIYFFAARFVTGAGIGGEYSPINSAIDELIPARVRGRVDLMINGSCWVGSAAGAAAALLFLDTSIFAADLGWRLAFGVGAVLGLTILLVRRNVPRARAGCSSTAARRRPSRSSRTSSSPQRTRPIPSSTRPGRRSPSVSASGSRFARSPAGLLVAWLRRPQPVNEGTLRMSWFAIDDARRIIGADARRADRAPRARDPVGQRLGVGRDPPAPAVRLQRPGLCPSSHGLATSITLNPGRQRSTRRRMENVSAMTRGVVPARGDIPGSYPSRSASRRSATASWMLAAIM
jgi:hypothetical protein